MRITKPVYMTKTRTRTPAPAMACEAVCVTAAVVRKIAAMTNVAIYVTTDSILAQNIIRRRISRPTEEEEELSRGVSQTGKEI
jgi:hypothetical protein